MRVPRDHLVRDIAHHRLKAEPPVLFAHGRVIHGLEQQIAQLSLKLGPVAPFDRIGNFIRFFNGIGGDAVEILFDIPRASGLRVTQAAHDFQQAFDPGVAIVDQRIISCLGHCSPHVSDVRCNLTNIPTGVQ